MATKANKVEQYIGKISELRSSRVEIDSPSWQADLVGGANARGLGMHLRAAEA
jgi:hypothetical protein